MRANLFYAKGRGNERVLVRETLSLERDEFALSRELEMRKTNSFGFFSESFEEKGARSLEISKRARSVSQRTRRRARGKNSRNLSRTFTCTRSCAFCSRGFFFLSRVCVFCLRALVFDDILLSRFQKPRYFSIFLLFFRRKYSKGGLPNEKEGTK